MTSMIVQIKEKLEESPTLVSLMPGGIWNRPLKANAAKAGSGRTTPMSTPEAFDELGIIRWSMVVTTDAAIEDPTTRKPLHAFQLQPVIWMYMPELDAEMDTFELVWLEVYDALQDQSIDGPNGTKVWLTVNGWFGPFGVEEFTDTVAMRIPLRGSGVWRVQ